MGRPNKNRRTDYGLEPKPYPWLLHSSSGTIRAKSFSATSKNTQVYSNRIHRLRYMIPCCSYFGWCIFMDAGSTDMILWNSANLEIITLPPLSLITLPPLSFAGSISDYVISSDPADPNCTIYLISDAESHCIITCQLHKQKHMQMRWVVLDIKENLRIALQEYGELLADDSFISHPVCCHGNLYAISSNRRLLLIDNNSVNALPIVIPSSDYFDPNAVRTHLVECEGKILAICRYAGGINYEEAMAVELYSVDCTKMTLDKVESLSEFVLFLGRGTASGSVCCRAVNANKEGGRIYFFPSFSSNTPPSCYNVEERSLSVLYHLRQENFDYWLMPQGYSESATLDYGVTTKNKKFMEVKEEATEDQLFFKLPPDMIHEIADRLCLADYCSFRSISKELGSLMSPVSNLKSALNRRWKTKSLHPWFVFFETYNIYSLFDPMHGEKYQLRLPNALAGCKICFSKDGLLLLTCPSTGFTAFFNPVTNEIFPLPARNISKSIFGAPSSSKSIFGASSSPMSPNCLVIDIADKYHGTINSISSEDSEWKDVLKDAAIGADVFFGNAVFNFYENSAIFYQGSFYCLGQDGNLGVLTVGEERPTWKVLSGLKKPCCSYKQLFLLECDKELMSVFVDNNEKRVRIFRFNLSTMAWIKVKSIGNRMICISRSSSFSCLAKVHWMENKVFFPRLSGQNIVFFCLDTKKFHTYTFEDDHLEPVKSCKTRELLISGWFEPRW